MFLKRIVLGLAFTALANIAISQNISGNVPNNGGMEQATISPRNSNTDTRWQRIEKLLTSAPTIGNVAVKTISYAALRFSESELNLQSKYATLLDVLPSTISNLILIESIDEWFGTRYRYGGTTKRGIDCSAFVRAALKSAFGFELPRTAREQYRASRRISATELREGDLVFFNTTGGVSHVGIYIRNNKFVHSSSTKGVTISDLYESYYRARFIGAGRVDHYNLTAKN